jgi:hypothetical protein
MDTRQSNGKELKKEKICKQSLKKQKFHVYEMSGFHLNFCPVNLVFFIRQILHKFISLADLFALKTLLK